MGNIRGLTANLISASSNISRQFVMPSQSRMYVGLAEILENIYDEILVHSLLTDHHGVEQFSAESSDSLNTLSLALPVFTSL